MPLFWQDSFEQESGPDLGGGTRTAPGHADTSNGTGPFDRNGDGTIDNTDQAELGIGNDPSGNFPFNSSGDDNYFVRYDGNRDTSLGIDRTFSGRDGDWIWIGEDVRDANEGEGNRPARDNDLGIIDWTGISTTGLSDISFTGLFASNNNGHTFEVGDFVRVSYAFDSTDEADLVTGIQFVGTGVRSDGLKLDVNQDGVWNVADDGDVDLGGPGTSTTIALQEFGFDLTGSGDTLFLRYQQSGVVGGGASEEVGIDNFRLDNAGVSGTPPVAAAIEPTDLAYTPNDAATAVTSTLTLVDVDSPNLEGATIAITSGASSGDVLNFTDANGISGTFTDGVLTLSGTASVAAYQAALRSVTYENTDDAAIGDRIITFTVNDGVSDSNEQTRTIDIADVPTDTSVFWLEDFELAAGPETGGGTREATNHADTLNGTGPMDLNGDGIIEEKGGAPDTIGAGGEDNYFVRTFVDSNNDDGSGDIDFNAGFNGKSGDWYWRAEDTRDSVGGGADSALRSNNLGTLNFFDIDISNKLDISFEGSFAGRTPSGFEFEVGDTLNVEYSVDGGAYVTGLSFLGTGSATDGLVWDENLNGTADASETTLLSEMFTDFGFNIAGTGSTLDLRIVYNDINSGGGNEEIGFDNLRLSAEAAVGSDVNGENGVRDVIDGTSASETINGLSGNDVLRGQAGNDTLNGGDGNDGLNGGLGADVMDGGAGTDSVVYLKANAGITLDLDDSSNNTGEAAGDTFISIERFFGSNHDDIMVGDVADNFFDGRDGEDSLAGGDGADTLYGRNDDDELFGDAGNDLLDGGAGNDELFGGDGADRLSGQDGDDVLNGGDGADRLLGQDGDDVLNGGLGRDILISGTGSDVFVFDTVDAGIAGRDAIIDFENGVDIIRYDAVVTDFADLTIIASGANSLIISDLGQITVVGVASTELDATDFEFFVPPPAAGAPQSDKVADALAVAAPAADGALDAGVDDSVFDAIDVA